VGPCQGGRYGDRDAIYSRAFNYEGRPAALVAICDVTEQRRAERDRDRNQKFLNSIIENIRSRCSSRAARAALHPGQSGGRADVGKSRTSVIGKTSHDIFPKHTRICRCADKELLETKCERVYETQPLATRQAGVSSGRGGSSSSTMTAGRNICSA